MSHDPQQPNVQAGVPLAPGNDPAAEEVATGNRREELHYEPDPDPDQMVAVKSLHRPTGSTPPEEQSESYETGEIAGEPYVGDVRVAPDGPSVWDARPPADEEPRSGNPTGH